MSRQPMNIPLPFTPADFVPLDVFGLAWRWTDPKHSVLLPGDLAAIRPFTETAAREAWARYGPVFGRFDFPGTPERWRIRTDGESADVRGWLERQSVLADTTILLLWEPEQAVSTRWDVFCHHWDAFCYPVSDDVLIVPLSEKWALAFWHEEQFLFRPNGDAETAAE